MSHSPMSQLLGEQLIDSRQAALMFNLPTYWLSQAKERQQRRIPHYRVGKLVRFKLGELLSWMQAQQPDASTEATDA